MVARICTSLTPLALTALAASQVNTMFPDGDEIDNRELLPAANRALQRLEYCFGRINNKYFFDGEKAIFDHLHGDQYAMWLYLLSNQLFLDRASISACKKLFLLNKALHGCDIYYEVELPSIFLLVHPLGTVLGRAKYNDYLIAYQRVSVGSNHNVYPNLGAHLTLHPGSAVLGNSNVSDLCSIAAESLLLDHDLPSNSIYIGNPRDHMIRPLEAFQPIWKT